MINECFSHRVPQVSEGGIFYSTFAKWPPMRIGSWKVDYVFKLFAEEMDGTIIKKITRAQIFQNMKIPKFGIQEKIVVNDASILG